MAVQKLNKRGFTLGPWVMSSNFQ